MEIWAHSSPLSRWMGKTVVKQLRFHLHFDDPRLPETQRIKVQGDRDQLEELNDVVTSYVQKLLQQSAENFAVNFSESIKSVVSSDPLNTKDIPEDLSSSPPQNLPTRKIYLEPGSNLTHKLYLGSLATQATSPEIQLSLLQLFDLATALDEYSVDVMTLPTLNRNLPHNALPTWASVAAVLIFAVGLTPLTWQYANHLREQPQQSATKITPATPVKIAGLPSSQINPQIKSQIDSQINSQLNLHTPKPGLNSPDGLKPLPNFGSTNPLSQIPGAQPAISSPNSAFDSKIKTSSQNPLTIPETNNYSVEKDLQIPLPPTQGSIYQGSPTGIRQNNVHLANSKKLPQIRYEFLPKISLVPRKLSHPTNIIAQAPTQPGSEILDKRGLLGIGSTQESYANYPTNTLTIDGKSSPASEMATGSTLFDTPQIVEARDYLKKRWQPPSGLTDSLEYSVTVGIDGTIERLLPLNQAAKDYIDSSGLPEIGKSFISPNKNGQYAKLRIVLSPDGKVQTFPESTP